MEPSLYVSLSGQLALQRRLDTVANNVANGATGGFRAENITFESIISRNATAYSSSGASTFSMRTGPLTQTDNPQDVAIDGNAFFAIATPQGTAYTRDGRLQISPTGDLQTLEGHRILDPGGAPIQVSTARGPLQIARNGEISQEGERVTSLGLFRLPADAKLSRGPGVSLISDKPAEPVGSPSNVGVVQGFAEASNVNPMTEMARMITISRTFDALSASLDNSDRKLTDAIRALSGAR